MIITFQYLKHSRKRIYKDYANPEAKFPVYQEVPKNFFLGSVLGGQAAVIFLKSCDILHTYIVLCVHINTYMEHWVIVALEVYYCLIPLFFFNLENNEKYSVDFFFQIQLQ